MLRIRRARRVAVIAATLAATIVTLALPARAADPAEPTVARMRAEGYRSAFAEANGADPAVTWPSGLQAPAMDTDGSPECLDYIWVRGPILVESARLAFDRPAGDDPTLYPSDHLGIEARLEIDVSGLPADGSAGQ